MNKKQKIGEQQQESDIASWASKWVSDNFQVRNEDLEKAITLHCNQNSLVELKSLLDALNNRKLGTIKNLFTLVNNKITTANQFTPLFDALNDSKRNLGTIENFLTLVNNKITTANQFTSLFDALETKLKEEKKIVETNEELFEIYVFLIENKVKSATTFNELEPSDREELKNTQGCPKPLKKYFQNLK